MSYQGMEVNELIKKVTLALKKAQYSDCYIEILSTIWHCLKNFMNSIGKKIYTVNIGIHFLEAEYGIKKHKKLSSNNRRRVRAINLLSDYILHGMILYRTKQKIYTYKKFQTIFQGYIEKKRTEKFSEDTITSYQIYLGRFSDYLNSHKITNIRDLDESTVLGFTDTFTRYSPSVIHNMLSTLRTFLYYLFYNEFVSCDYTYIVPRDGYRQRAIVPSTYSKDEVEQLLRAIDRGNPKGKRDYAIILIAARIGLRAQDICNLSFDNLKWETNTIELIQEKTEDKIVLPLLEDVGLAIIDYLKYSRPQYQATKKIFLRLVPPMGKLEAPTLHSIVTQHMRTAGIKIQNGKKHGPHALRHSLASVLLEEKTPLPVISEILGHRSSASTSDYLKIDINQLRSCSLEPLPYDWDKGKELF
jgi:site-specific recombinase XerD